MRLLDLFCGAGGAAKGYAEAGFEVVGVDINPQPNFPYEFHKADAMTFDLSGYDAIHASPPCQAYSWAAARWNKPWPELVPGTRDRLNASGVPYIIENVVGAPLRHPITLCGTMFNLGVIRHRLFEANFPLTAPPHPKHVGSVEEGDYVTVAGHGGDGSSKIKDWQKAMDITWMTKQEMTQSIPPAYTRYLGEALMNHLTKKPVGLAAKW